MPAARREPSSVTRIPESAWVVIEMLFSFTRAFRSLAKLEPEIAPVANRFVRENGDAGCPDQVEGVHILFRHAAKITGRGGVRPVKLHEDDHLGGIGRQHGERADDASRSDRNEFGHLRVCHLAQTGRRKDGTTCGRLARQKLLAFQAVEEAQEQWVGVISLRYPPARIDELDVLRLLAIPLPCGAHASSTPTSCVWNSPPVAVTIARGAFNSTCRSPASPRNCVTASAMRTRPDALIGLPQVAPPDGFAGSGAVRWTSPAAMRGAASPLPHNPSPSMLSSSKMPKDA